MIRVVYCDIICVLAQSPFWVGSREVPFFLVFWHVVNAFRAPAAGFVEYIPALLPVAPRLARVNLPCVFSRGHRSPRCGQLERSREGKLYKAVAIKVFGSIHKQISKFIERVHFFLFIFFGMDTCEIHFPCMSSDAPLNTSPNGSEHILYIYFLFLRSHLLPSSAGTFPAHRRCSLPSHSAT